MSESPGPAPFTIHRALPEDWQRLRALRLRALRTDPDAFGSTLAQALAFPEQRWRDQMTDPATTFFIAALDRTDIGLARLSIRDGLAGLYSMWVAPESRGLGVGEALVNRVIAEADSLGHSCLFLEVIDSNRDAVRLYERCGFIPTGRTQHLDPPREHLTEHERILRW